MRNSRRQYLCLFQSKGSILIVTVWVLVAFSILSVGLYGIVSSRLTLARNLEGRIAGQYLAKAACVYFKAKRAQGQKTFTTVSELQEKRPLQEFGRGKFVYTLQDEEGRININASPADIIARLPGFNKDLADKICESSLRPFHAKEELLLVEDMTEEIFNNCKDLITVYGPGSVDINTASPEVLQILGLDSSLIKIIADFRAGPDGKEGTADDGVFENTAEIINKLRAFTSLFEAEEAKLVQLISQNMFSVLSQTFSLQIETAILEKTAMRYNIIIDKDRIRRWEEM